MNEFKLLSIKELLKFKNNILLILKSPGRLIAYALGIAYLIWIYTMRSGKDALDTSPFADLDFGMDGSAILVGVFTVILLIYFCFRLYKSTSTNVTFFSMADVNMLFTAPARPQRILLFYILRSILPAMFFGLIFTIYISFFIFPAGMLTAIDNISMLIAITLFIASLGPLQFLVFILNTKFNIEKPLKLGIRLSIGGVAALIAIPAALNDEPWKGAIQWISADGFNYFPIVGWARGIGLSFYYLNTGQTLFLILLFVIFLGMTIAAILRYADDYYEDVLDSTAENEELQERIRKNKRKSEADVSLNSKKELNIKPFGKGAIAFFWRNWVEGWRIDYNPLLGFYNFIIIAIGVVVAILISVKIIDSENVILIYQAVLATIFFAAGMQKSYMGDFQKPHFILVPVSFAKKLTAVLALDVIQVIIPTLILEIVFTILVHGELGRIFLAPLLFVSLYLVGISISLLSKVGFKESWDRFLIRPIIIGLIFLVGILPVIIVAIMVGSALGSVYFVFLFLALGLISIALILLNVTTDLLERFELK
ncbi:MAG: putative ABC exporter domain-containing protein [Cyclobacteriaceae bacterium]|nr:putative ABC exporter domain-containing protein [Cyclobacteriaceae bacterium]MCH8516670.1 putative ABC exporter domain-containing protein [Cyclobacteriaceae bacterium]